MQIPAGPEELTPQWLTGALRATGTITQSRATALTTTNLDEAKGMSGRLAQVQVTYDWLESGAPTTLVAKFPAADTQLRDALFRVTGHYEQEVRFYERLADRIELRTPRCYFSALDVPAQRSILLLEHLQHARGGDSLAGCSIDETELAIRQIAQLHTTWWESPEFSSMSWLLPRRAGRQEAQLQEVYRGCWPRFVQTRKQPLPAEVLRVGHGLCRQLAAVMRHLRSSPRTLAHFDYRLDNLFFAAPHSPHPLIVLDWQNVTSGRGVFDVASLLCFDMEPRQRRRREVELLGIYHAHLGRKVKGDYSFAQCVYDYRVSMLELFSRLVMVACDQIPSQHQPLLERVIPHSMAALVDLKLDQLVPRTAGS